MHRFALALALAAGCATETALSGPDAPDETLARSLAALASDEDFTVPMNDVIHESLAAWVGPRREFTVGALARHAEAAATIDPMIAARGLPTELIAVAFVESGFQDLPQKAPFPSAGTWQFIAPTARAYGLRVDDTVDERLDRPKATMAALRLLSDLHAALGDWGLAFAGYNQGYAHVMDAIETEGTDDPWELVRRGAIHPYAADVMSAVIVLEHSEALGL